MTITIAWERRLSTYSELVFCSDSRLNGGGNIDVCQKIFPLPREDAAIGSCGSTLIAYPIIHQFSSYIKHYKKNLDRALDGTELPKRFCDLANNFLKSYIDPVNLVEELRETSFLIGCFSWRLKRPIISRITYDNGPKIYVAASARFPKSKSKNLSSGGQFSIIGDLRNQFFDTLASYINYTDCKNFDMEPFSALSEMLSNSTYVDRRGPHRGVIGGAPQILKVYPFLRTIEFAVFWPSKIGGKLYLNGRETFDYEKIHVPHLDSKSLDVHYPLGEIGNSAPDPVVTF